MLEAARESHGFSGARWQIRQPSGSVSRHTSSMQLARRESSERKGGFRDSAKGKFLWVCPLISLRIGGALKPAALSGRHVCGLESLLVRERLPTGVADVKDAQHGAHQHLGFIGAAMRAVESVVQHWEPPRIASARQRERQWCGLRVGWQCTRVLCRHNEFKHGRMGRRTRSS
jgi:hypothetical protein